MAADTVAFHGNCWHQQATPPSCEALAGHGFDGPPLPGQLRNRLAPPQSSRLNAC